MSDETIENYKKLSSELNNLIKSEKAIPTMHAFTEIYIKVIETLIEKGISIQPFENFSLLKFRRSLTPESDRGCALLAVAFLDNLIQKLLQKYFIDNKQVVDNIFTGTGALSSFSSRIELAYLLGLISPDTRRDLNLLRKIRNEFAHSMEILSFQDQRIEARCKELKNNIQTDEQDARSMFVTTVFRIAGIIFGETLLINKKNQKENEGVDKSAQMMTEILSMTLDRVNQIENSEKEDES
ncbi:MltR family transcriptional regulator [Paenibacillus sp. EZ-K15]|uniref:MltR family transcriptional regulator n=1 Tax=Paenibacillus sp. EZ-K15 TaxID=2044275 RepID=UPI000BF5519D|nr:MltR family transcriptional regulator [Paenibacillus sp. EZ-K15]